MTCRYSNKLEQLYQEVKNVQFIDNVHWWEAAQALLLQSNKEKNARMKVLALQHLGEASFHLNYIEDSINYIMQGVAVCEKYRFLEIEANLYNLLGIILFNQSNEIQAVDYYMKALDCLQGFDNHLMRATVYNNIANIYVSLGDYETAMKCYDIVKEYMDKESKLQCVDEGYIVNEVNYLINRCLTYCAMKEYSKALGCQWELMKYEDKKEVSFIKQFFNVANAKIGYNLGEIEQFKFYIRLLLEGEHKVSLIADIFSEYIELLQYLLDSNELDLARQFLKVIEMVIDDNSSDTMLLSYYRVLIKFYKATEQENLLASVYIDYFQLIKRQESMMNGIKILSIKTKQRLHLELKEQSKYEKEVRRLKLQSELDALTQLPNRYRLNEVGEKLFRKALMDHLTFGILILDIDYFKEYNDFYGHLKGDDCICRVAKTIKECSKGLFCSRFGGDEFFIISINQQEEDLYQIAKSIKSKVMELQIKHQEGIEFEYVTVSQGICVDIPESGQTFADFTHAADMALYRGKSSTRNSIFFGNLDFQ